MINTEIEISITLIIRLREVQRERRRKVKLETFTFERSTQPPLANPAWLPEVQNRIGTEGGPPNHHFEVKQFFLLESFLKKDEEKVKHEAGYQVY